MSRGAALAPSVVESVRQDPRYRGAVTHRSMHAHWRSRGLCLQYDPELFFPHPAEDPSPALVVCRRCPVQAECLAGALTAGEVEGIWGATTPDERQVMRRVWVQADKLPTHLRI